MNTADLKNLQKELKNLDPFIHYLRSLDYQLTLGKQLLRNLRHNQMEDTHVMYQGNFCGWGNDLCSGKQSEEDIKKEDRQMLATTMNKLQVFFPEADMKIVDDDVRWYHARISVNFNPVVKNESLDI